MRLSLRGKGCTEEVFFINKLNKNLQLTVLLAMLTAISIVCGKYLAINGGEVMRFSLENMPIIFAGMAFGPLAGALVGTVADLVGCLMVGYTVNPLVTLGAALIGAVSGAVPMSLRKINIRPCLLTSLSVFCAHLIGSVIIKTVGLSAYYSMPFGILMLWRLLNYIIVGALDGIIVHTLLGNKEIKMRISRIMEEKK